MKGRERSGFYFCGGPFDFDQAASYLLSWHFAAFVLPVRKSDLGRERSQHGVQHLWVPSLLSCRAPARWCVQRQLCCGALVFIPQIV